jgi:hypothetical protein
VYGTIVSNVCSRSQAQPVSGLRSAAIMSTSRPASRDGCISLPAASFDRNRQSFPAFWRIDDPHRYRLAFGEALNPGWAED